MLADARVRGSIHGFVDRGWHARPGARLRRGDLSEAEGDLRTGSRSSQEHGMRVRGARRAALGPRRDARAPGPRRHRRARARASSCRPRSRRRCSGAWMHEVRGQPAAPGRRPRRRGRRAAPRRPDLRRAALQQPGTSRWRSVLALPTEDHDEALGLARERARGRPARRAATRHRRRAADARPARGLDSALLRAAVDGAGALARRLEHARAQVELGAALRRANQRAEAREPLRAGLDLAQRCGATRLAERARSELRATGARPRRAALTGRAALTASERRDRRDGRRRPCPTRRSRRRCS